MQLRIIHCLMSFMEYPCRPRPLRSYHCRPLPRRPRPTRSCHCRPLPRRPHPHRQHPRKPSQIRLCSPKGLETSSIHAPDVIMPLEKRSVCWNIFIQFISKLKTIFVTFVPKFRKDFQFGMILKNIYYYHTI